MSSKALLFLNLASDFVSFFTTFVADGIHTFIHYHTYRPAPSPKNVVIIGASYAGYFCADRLAKSLPSGWRVILVEKNSHFNHTWLFPRISVITRHSELAYIPYPGKAQGMVPEGVWMFKEGQVTAVEPDKKRIVLEDGESIDFEYLVLATGLPGRYPTGIDHMQREEGLAYFRRLQGQVKEASSLVIVGGGPVGIEIALDVKSEYPSKAVVLVHSRDRLANKYGPGLHDVCLKALNEAGVKVILKERIKRESEDSTQVKLSTGEVVAGDMVIMCTGSTAATTPLSGIPISAINPTGMLRVDRYLQVDDPSAPHIFAVGDIADTGAKKMGRAASLQGQTAAANIVRSISGRTMKPYKAGLIENGIDMTLALDTHLLYVEKGTACYQSVYRTKDETIRAEQMWKWFGMTPD